MLKISLVILATTAVAGLLIYDPYQPILSNPALLMSMSSGSASGPPASAQAGSSGAPEVAAAIKPQDIEDIFVKVLADRVVTQDKVCPKAVEAAPPDDRPVATVEQPQSARATSEQQPAPQDAAESAVPEPVSVKREDEPVPAPAPAPSEALSDKPIEAVVRPVLARRKEPLASQADGHVRRFRHARTMKIQAPAAQPASGRPYEDASIPGTNGATADRPIASRRAATVAGRRQPVSGADENFRRVRVVQ